jgi:hypothetical protein
MLKLSDLKDIKLSDKLKFKLPKRKEKLGKITGSSVVTLDPYSLKSYSYKKNILEQVGINQYDKSSFYSSYIQTKDVISSTVDIHRGVTDEDIHDAIEIKAYDELGLDGEIEYEIFYFESNKRDGEDRIFNVIAVDKAKLQHIFAESKDIKYIDYITIAPFLIKSAYTRNMLEPSGVDCFIYFHKNDAFVSIYQDGDYLFSKSIRYSLKVIADTFSKELGKRVDEEEFYQMLSNSGLMNQNSSYQQQLMKLFGEVFVYINDVLLYAKRVYNLSVIDNIYIGSEIGHISGIEEFCHNYVNIDTKKLDFKISKNANEVNTDQIHTLMMLSAFDYQDSNDETYNFSVFKRPPPFSQRPSGKLSKIAAATLFASLAYPVYQYSYDNFVLKKEIKTLESLHTRLSQESTQRKIDLKEAEDKDKKVQDMIDEQDKELEFRTKLLTEIYHKKVSYPMKAEILTELFSYITKHNSKVLSVENVDKDMVITVRSTNDKHVTELLKDIAHFKKYDVSTELIKKDDNTSVYESAIKVGLNGK